jgi:hypothetical protein
MMEHKVDAVCSVPYTMAQLGREKETGVVFSPWARFLTGACKRASIYLKCESFSLLINEYNGSIINS